MKIQIDYPQHSESQRVFSDRYRIQSLLGRQNGRRTFLALDLQTERLVVLKLLLFDPDFTWDDLKLFEREAEVLKSLDLPAIPKYLDCFDVDTELGKGFMLVQTHIEAKSLQHWLKAGRTFSEEELVEIAKSLLAILDYLHSHQPAVIHRDIKPSNILLSDRSGHSPGQVYLVDFGSVQTAAAVEGSTITVVGTYGYMPPEQFGGQITPASDLYALGATMICLATGQHPSRLPHRKLQIIFADLVNLTPHLVDWLKWMTAASKDSRFKSAATALAALEGSAEIGRGASIAVSKPLGSKVAIEKTEEVLKITIPPRGLQSDSIGSIFGAIVWHLVMLPFGYVLILLSGAPLYIIPSIIIGSWFILQDIIFRLGQKQIFQINEDEISLVSEFCGFECSSFVADRQCVLKVEILPVTYHIGNGGDRVSSPPQLNILIGTKKLDLADGTKLTSPERDWLFYELSDWLGMTSDLRKCDASRE
jgi:serine/threonine protein kinase